MKKFTYGVAMVLAMAFFNGCGSTEESQTVTVPSSASEAKIAYDAAPKMLESYFYEVENFGKSSNPDTVATSSELGTHLTVVYKGVEIYNETHHWGIYMGHGFMKDGTYVILFREYDGGSYIGSSKLFVNGKKLVLLEEAGLPLYFPINDIKESEDGWLILLCQNGSTRTGIRSNWKIFNPSATGIRHLGDSGTIQ